MKTLVLGGSVFVGFNIVKELLARGHEVAVLNRGQTRASLPGEVKRLRADRNDSASMHAALHGLSFDAILDVSGYTREHVQAALDAVGDRVGQYIFCSTTAVYFGSAIYPLREDAQLMQDARGGPYALGKVSGEKALAEWSQHSRIPFTVVRPTYVFGAGTPRSELEPSYFYRVEHGRPLLMPNRGIPLTHLIHVEDLAQIFAQCLGNPRAYGQAYNAAALDFPSIRGWCMAIGEAMGAQPELVSVPDELTPMMKGFPFQARRCVVFSMDKAVRDLDYRPKYATSAGLAQSYAWYKRELSSTFSYDLSEDEAVLAEIKKRGGS